MEVKERGKARVEAQKSGTRPKDEDEMVECFRIAVEGTDVWIAMKKDDAQRSLVLLDDGDDDGDDSHHHRHRHRHRRQKKEGRGKEDDEGGGGGGGKERERSREKKRKEEKKRKKKSQRREREQHVPFKRKKDGDENATLMTMTNESSEISEPPRSPEIATMIKSPHQRRIISQLLESSDAVSMIPSSAMSTVIEGDPTAMTTEPIQQKPPDGGDDGGGGIETTVEAATMMTMATSSPSVSLFTTIDDP